MGIRWIKSSAELCTGTIGPFTLKVLAKGDGRFSWQVFRNGTPNPTASGVAASLGAAKAVTEQLVNRSGLI